MARKSKKEALVAAESTEELLKSAAIDALEELLRLAKSETTDSKTKYDVYKWLCEMYFGKPTSTSQKSDSSEKSFLLAFTGELDKWSK